jgi:hypothetical protein
MKRLLYIGFTFHEKTKSADFMINMLREQYVVEIYLVDLFEENPYTKIAQYAGDYDTLVCWQVMRDADLLNQYFTYKHAVLFPMADGSPSVKNIEKWYPFRNFQIISFSKKLHDELEAAGFSSHYFQYFPAPQPVDEWGDAESAFFWKRSKRITFDTVAKLSQSSSIKKVHIHNVPDPGNPLTLPDESDTLTYTFSYWFEDKEELINLIKKSAYYIAPRIDEGIGMSFLDAMATGRCVIASNATTMNEYIQHGVNGLLYDVNDPPSIGTVDVREMQRNALVTIQLGHEQWNLSIPKLMNLLEEPPKVQLLRLVFKKIKRTIRRKLKR